MVTVPHCIASPICRPVLDRQAASPAGPSGFGTQVPSPGAFADLNSGVHARPARQVHLRWLSSALGSMRQAPPQPPMQLGALELGLQLVERPEPLARGEIVMRTSVSPSASRCRILSRRG